MMGGMMRFAIGATLAGAALAVAGAALAQSGPPAPVYGWSPKPSPYGAYKAPNRAHWKLADVLAMHKGQASWDQPIVRNKDLRADWHQLAPAGRTVPVMSADTRVGLIVWSGQVRVTMEGQPPFVASKGFEIDVPFRVPFSLEVVGNEPALWFEVHQADDVPIYPASMAEKPKDLPGRTYTKVVLSGGAGTHDEQNKPYLDYYKDVVNGSTRATAFISAPQMFVNNIRGPGVKTPPNTVLGHFHAEYDEFWFIMEGNIDYQIEGVPFFTASPGDIVTAATGRYHRASFGGPVGQMDTRVAINPYPRGLHNFPEASGGRQ
jgi:mannose-6-phosphate isomerase-like protein (cupin superfamily)